MTDWTPPDWTPSDYLAFADHRLRPALDLLARVPLERPAHVVDLGCGTGTLTRHARTRWPDAAILGVDASPAMLARARAESAPDIAWAEADIATWTPPREARPDVLLSNAALHWLGDHDRLFPRLLSLLAPGGVLAVQMPRNFDRPSHALVKTVAADGPWADRFADLIARPAPVDPPDAYAARLLAAGAADLALWETDYQQILPGGPETIADVTRSTTLRPWLARLEDDPTKRDAFLAAYRARVAAAYTALPDGRTLFPFRRLFLIATRPDA
ncbi:methyltransferase domain-containing protein [Roseospira marina]|uniref:Methyltransferase domain-containing protein n=1 Tax=Roseospira marina TaxID=140057 RepID=A0A5M6IBM2_9PROT|nr:methyltransferase domain-containing protein [Roseospira marina]KAA5605656.1 methyltransferase domain-containing protein [Roseospira marina]MBB4313268.1 trans-aconitate 2-methyltransferase [Roseospira marina]MBB5085991.1 trans-aconitate 2-methyltransferase [Roseospira marina]